MSSVTGRQRLNKTGEVEKKNANFCFDQKLAE